MHTLFALLLRCIHLIYAAFLFIRLFWERRCSKDPEPLHAPRRRLPKHLAIIFERDATLPAEVAQESLVDSVINAVEWCRTIGIMRLTVYEEHDLLSKCVDRLRGSLPTCPLDIDSSESETEYPLTPPPSDYSESRPLSPIQNHPAINPLTILRVSDSKLSKDMTSLERLKCRHIRNSGSPGPQYQRGLTLCLASRRSSKEAIASTARSLARMSSTRKTTQRPLTVDQLSQLLEDEDGLTSPDFMIIHSLGLRGTMPPELHGFPPWHIRLTEIYQNQTPPSFHDERFFTPLDEPSFARALDEFASAEMRFGK